MIKQVLAAIIALSIVFCKDKKLEPFSEEKSKQLSEYTQEWLSFYKVKQKGLKLENFRLISTSEKVINAFDFDFETSEDEFLIYSKDKKKAFDLFFYSQVEKIGDEYLFSWDANSDIRLHDMINKKSYILGSYGTAGGYDDAVWINDNEFLLFSKCDVEGDGYFTLRLSKYEMMNLNNDELTVNITEYEQKTKIKYGDIPTSYLRYKFDKKISL